MQLSKLYIAFTLLAGSMIPAFSQADVSGTVYREFPVNGAAANTYGVQDANEQGVAGIDVIVTGDNSATETVQTDANGNWTTTLGAGAFGSDVKVEFTNIPSYLHSSPVNTDSNTTVQFVSDNTTGVDLGLHNPADYSDVVDQELVTTGHYNGDPLAGGTTGAAPGVYLLNESDGITWYDPTAFSVVTNLSEIGATWGLAYQHSNNRLFLGSLIKRHVGLGSLGIGGIYTLDTNTSTVTNWLDINTLAGVNVGVDPRVEEGSMLPPNLTDPNYDVLAFDAVGKRGIGDVDISEDETTLYAMNLASRELVIIDIATQSLINTVAVPNPDPATIHPDDYRPFGIGVRDGEVYIGIVNSEENGRDPNELHAYLMRLDGASFTPVLDFPLNFSRGVFVAGGQPADWDPWARDWNDVIENQPSATYSHIISPIFSDIEFDPDGSLLLGFMDRGGHQIGAANYPADTNLSNTARSALAQGDIYRACPDGVGGWLLESNGSCGGVTTAGAGNAEGPDGGEFYLGDFGYDNTVHQNSSLGGLAVLPGSGRVISAHMDAVTGVTSHQGIRWLSNTTGDSVQEFMLVNWGADGSFAKGNGLGEIELLGAPAPLEIGNRVWDDLDGNGVQDAGEPAIQGVTVTLTCGGLTATSTSGANGEWLIQDGDMTGGVDIPRNASCTISVPMAEPNNGNGITTQLSNTATGNDADPATGSFTITTGRSGQNNHTYDIGYSDFSPPSSGCTSITNTASVTSVTETDTNNTNDGSSADVQINCTTATPQMDLRLVKTADKTAVLAGDTLTYTLILRNEGTEDATNIEITDNLPAGVTHVSSTPSQGSYDTGTGIWTVGDVAVGVTVTLDIEVTVN